MTLPAREPQDSDLVHILATGDPPIEGALYSAHFAGGRTSFPVPRHVARDIVGLYPTDLQIEEIEREPDEEPVAQISAPSPAASFAHEEGEPRDPDRDLDKDEEPQGRDNDEDGGPDVRREKLSDLAVSADVLPEPRSEPEALAIMCARASGRLPAPGGHEPPASAAVGRLMFRALFKQAFAHFPLASHPREFMQLMQAKKMLDADAPSMELPSVQIDDPPKSDKA